MSDKVRNRRSSVSSLVDRFERIHLRIETEVFRGSQRYRKTRNDPARKNVALRRFTSASRCELPLVRKSAKNATEELDEDMEPALRNYSQFSIVAHDIDIGERMPPSKATQPIKRCPPRHQDSHYISLSQLRRKLTLVHFGELEHSSDEASTDEEDVDRGPTGAEFKLEDNEGQYVTITKYRPVYCSAKATAPSAEEKTLLYKTLHVYDSDQKLCKVENYKVSIVENEPEVQVQQFKSKKEYVVDELITTEEEYVRKLAYAVENYYDFLAGSIPADVDKIFQNLDAIRSDTTRFMRTLKSLRHCYEAIGVHFVENKNVFERYLLYIRNKRVSEAKCEEYKDLIRKREDHICDMHGLSSYLLRPIQRLAKYELLLKKLAKCVNEPEEVESISEAANLIRRIASKGNDIIELDLITGKPHHFGTTGNLILRDHFREHTHFRCDIVLFLFKRKLIFTRKDNKIADNYLYLSAIDTRSLGIIPAGDRANAFTVQNHHKGKIANYRLTARTRDIKSKWVKEIQTILWQQLEERKSKMRQLNNNIIFKF